MKDETPIPYEDSLKVLKDQTYVRVGKAHSATSEDELKRVYKTLGWDYPGKPAAEKEAKA